MQRIFLLLLFSSSLIVCHAQNDSAKTKLALIAGAGNYEYFHAGTHLLFIDKIYFETSLGIKPWGFRANLYTMLCLNLGTKILKKREQPRFLEPSFHLKAVAWYFNNTYNRLLVVASGAELRLSFRLSNKFQLFANGGVVYNSVPYYERKTYSEVGWPKEWQPSFSLQCAYWIK